MAADLELSGDSTPFAQLEASVDRARALLDALRADKSRLEARVQELESRVRTLAREVEAARRAAAPEELARLRAAEREWHEERQRIASRIETTIQKLDALDAM